MQRHTITPRHQWQHAVEKLGFGFHTHPIAYWDESVAYSFSMNEIVALEKATTTLWDMCLSAVQHIIDEDRYAQLGIPTNAIHLIEKSWQEDHPSIYGRFDLCYKNNEIKLLEFNADTPTSLFEAGIVQWFWLKDIDANKDQFNSIHEQLIDYWKYLKNYLHNDTLYFACLKETLEDLTNTEYLRDCAIQAGLNTSLIFIDDIGWDATQSRFVDEDGNTIKNIFKLYPWEWLLADEFGKNITLDAQRTFWIEPAWKMLLSNKGILPILWELYPEHPLLLPAYFTSNNLTQYVKKPMLSREGANINIVDGTQTLAATTGIYGKEGFVYQALCTLPEFNGNYPVIGSWVIGQAPAGIGIREANQLITNNESRFVPHYIEG